MTCKIVPKLEEFPDLPQETYDLTFVVIDTLNFSTTVVYLLHNEASYVRPCRNKNEALSFKRTVEDAVILGEEDGEKIEGFDFNNSPSDIGDVSFDGRAVAVLSSNGTRAIETIGRDQEIYLGSTVNAAAVASVLEDSDNDIYLVAAGKLGETVAEDVIGAEMIQTYYEGGDLDGATRSTYSERIRTSVTAERLRELGYESDIEKVLEYDSSNIVPKLEAGDFVKTIA